MIFCKNITASVGQTENRTLLMQGGSLGPTMYKCLKLGVLLSLKKEDVWIDHGFGTEPWNISNDLSHELRKLNSQNGPTYGRTYDITLAMILFADDMQLYFDSRQQLEAGTTEFINHLKRWGLHVHDAENEEEKKQIHGNVCSGKSNNGNWSNATFEGPWRMDTICGRVQIPWKYIHTRPEAR